MPELHPTPTQEENDAAKMEAVGNVTPMVGPPPEDRASISEHPESSPTQAENDLAALKACGPPPSSYLERPPIVVDVPYVDGSGVVGGMLTVTMGNWTGEPKSYAYQWMSADKAVGTETTYSPKSNDVGNAVGCYVAATNDFGSTVAPLSNTIVVTAAAAATEARAKK